MNSWAILSGRRGAARLLLCALALMLCIPSAVMGQATATITGTVRDATGAVIPGAEVTVSSAAIGLARTTVTNDDGDYLAGALPAGKYDLSVKAKGFKVFQAKGIVVQVAEKARVDVTLEVGEVSENVIVEGTSVAQVETQSSDLSGVVTGKEISQLELNGRDFSRLVTLVPGVSNQTGRDTGQVGLNGNINYSINGGRMEYNNWQVDGANNMDTGSNATLDVFPNVDAIAEFRVLTSNYSAVYGRNGSGNIEVVTKSGTQSFHGDVFEYLRNDFFNANTFFNNAAGTNPDGSPVAPRPQYKKHDFGYTIGGPVYIPHHYNTNKDKTFFFWSEEWRREKNPFSFNQQVPSTAERTGSFNDLCPAIPTGQTTTTFYRDATVAPTGTTVFPECPATGAGASPNTFVTFPNNNVPIDPNAQAMLSALIPAPSTTIGGAPFFIGSVSEPLTWRQELLRVDHNFSSRLRLMGRYIHDSYKSTDPTVTFVGNPFPSVQTNIGTPGTSFVLNLTATASPSLLNEFIFSYSADHLILTNTGNFQVPSAFTMTSFFKTGTGGKQLAQLPAISLLNGNAYGGGFTVNPGFMPWENANPTYGYRDTVTKIIGSHNLQFGGEFIAIQKNEPNAPTSDGLGGVLSFDETSPVSTGNSFADFLTGNIAKYGQTSAIVKYYYRYKIFEPYFQDDWHVTKRLTLNLGLRVSLFQTNRDISKASFNFDPSVWTMAAAPTIDDANGTLTTVPSSLVPPAKGGNPNGNPFDGFVQCGGPGGTGSVPAPILAQFPKASVAGTTRPGCMKGHLFNPGPRFGFAFDPKGDGKTAIRGGYGIFFEYGNGNEANAESLEGTPPKVLTASQPNITGYTSIGGGGGALALFPFTVNNEPPAIIETQVRWPYVQQWNLDVQRELPGHFVASVSYVGSKGTHLTDTRDLNQVHSLPLSQNPYKPGEAIGPNDCTPDASGNFFTPSGVQITGQALVNLNIACGSDANPSRPFFGFGTLELLETQANSHYNALQASLRRSVGSLELNVAYTYSHSIDDSSDRLDSTASNGIFGFLDSYNIAGNKASSNFDQRHILNVGYVYDLPLFGKSSGLTKTFLGGWQWSGITIFQSGIPFNVSFTGFPDNAGVGNNVDGRSSNSRPDLVGNPNSAPSQASPGPGPFLFNPAAFAAPRGLTFGDVGRNLLHLPFRTNFDMGLFKRFAIKESTAVEFRWETFNTFNHTQFDTVHGGFGSGTFLQASAAHDPRIMQFALKFIF
jgi:hypothetical protein